MSQPYSQLKAFAAITKAALRSIAKSPSSVVFTIAFPLVFILVFGFLGGGGGYSIKVALTPGSDTLNPIYAGLRQADIISFTSVTDEAKIQEQFKKGNISALIDIRKTNSEPAYKVALKVNAADREKGKQLAAVIKAVVLARDEVANTRATALLNVEQTIIQSRKFSTIDFILPGQLGFSLLAASVFGTAFVFFNLRQALVLKRFFATPVRRQYVLLAEGFARMIFQLLGALFIILVGHFAFGYTLIHGAWTVLNMLFVCALALLVFMSFGFIISGLAKSESTIPPLSNMITLPQFLLAGTFFSIEAFPGWMQPISKALPLTYLNDALREIAFEGASLWDVKTDIGILLLWGAVGYLVASKVFKWE